MGRRPRETDDPFSMRASSRISAHWRPFFFPASLTPFAMGMLAWIDIKLHDEQEKSGIKNGVFDRHRGKQISMIFFPSPLFCWHCVFLSYQ